MPHESDKGDLVDLRLDRSLHEAEHLSRRLNRVQDSLITVKRIVEEQETDTCLLESHEERLKSIEVLRGSN